MGRTACTEPQCLYKGALYLYLYLFSESKIVIFYPHPNSGTPEIYSWTPMGSVDHRLRAAALYLNVSFSYNMYYL